MITVPALPVVGPLAVFGLMWGLNRLHRAGGLNGYRFVTAVATTGYAAGVVLVTMFPMRLAFGEFVTHSDWTARMNLIPITTIDAPTFNLNVAMMIPLGLLLPLLAPVRSWGGALRWGVLVSFCIESTQFLFGVVFSAGRLADVNDIIANTIGTVFGYAVYVIAAGTPGLDALLRRAAIFPATAAVDREQTPRVYLDVS